jgi:Trypsin-like peptidase domain/TIR domain
MAGNIFISYRREDSAGFAQALFLSLERSFPEKLFMDVEGIEAGQDFVQAIEEQVRACDAMLVLIGPNWLTARDDAGRRRLDHLEDFVRIEIDSALRFGKRVIPVLLQKAEMPRGDALPEALRPLARRNAFGLTHERFRTDAQGLIKALESALAEAEETRRKAAAAMQRRVEQAASSAGQLEAHLVRAAPETYRWWRRGLERASSVCAVRQRLGHLFGSGFLVRAGDLGLAPPDELVIVTNFSVVNEEGAFGALKADATEVVFEAVDPVQACSVEAIRWQSPIEQHNASVLRVQSAVVSVAPLPLAVALPPVERNANVYIIGHPGGSELAFSFQDNQLLDHEGPPGGAPQIPGVSRVHYRVPTEPGSGGSPVFNENWEMIALHHKGGGSGLPRLNGKAGRYSANEGISILSIKAAIEQSRVAAR